MQKSPQGREIEWIEGTPGTIGDRGDEIVSLGDQMINSAAILKSIADGASGMKGLSVGKLKEVVGDAHEQLKLAGERYTPTGKYLKDYAEALSDVQSGLRTIIDDCETYWNQYENRQDDYGDAKSAANPLLLASPLPEVGAPDPQDKVDDAEGDMNVAHDKWENEAEKYDVKYDTWETAFDDAASKIGKATEGGISDSWKDNFDGFVDAALQVLAIVGFVLGVLCLIIGGPLLAALALIVGIIALVGTIYLATQGKKDGWDVAWAVVGVVPFGKLGSLFKAGQRGTFFKGFVGGGKWGEAGTQLKGGFSAFRRGFGAGSPGLPRLLNAPKSWLTSLKSTAGGGSDVLARYFGASDMNALNKLMDDGDVVSIVAGHASKVKTIIKSWVLGQIVPLFQTSPADKWKTELAR